MLGSRIHRCSAGMGLYVARASESAVCMKVAYFPDKSIAMNLKPAWMRFCVRACSPFIMKSENKEPKTSQDLIEPEEPGWFEKLGINYFKKLSRDESDRYEMARTDDEMAAMVRKTTLTNASIAFIIGAVSAGGTVAVEQNHQSIGSSMLVTYGWSGAVTALLTGVEFLVLFLVSIRVVFFIARITGHSRLHTEAGKPDVEIPNLLARAALEIPDPVRHIMGIDPMKRVSKKMMVIVGLLYKLKIMASNVLGKLVLKRLLGKGAFRVLATWVSVPITGLWNAFVVIKVAREARMRLFGNLLANYLVTEIITKEKLDRLSPRARLACVRAVGNSVVLTQNYHPNMLILVIRLVKLLDIQEGQDLDDWDLFLTDLQAIQEHERFFVLDLLSISTAFDGRLSRLEKRELPHAFGEHTDIYFKRIKELRDLMMNGRLYRARELCQLDFKPG
jgi:hypothetical protein